MKGGIGSCAFSHGNLTVGVVIAVNCIGDIYDYEKGSMVAGLRTEDGRRFDSNHISIAYLLIYLLWINPSRVSNSAKGC